MKHYTAEQIKAAVRLEHLLVPVARSLVEYSAGRAVSSIAHLEWGQNEVHIKNGHLLGGRLFVVKVATSFPGHAPMPLNGVQMVFDALSGEPAALLQDGGYLTDLRTAAAGAVAAQALAPEAIRSVGILGTGTQGRLQPLALSLVRKFERLLVWGRNPGKAQALADHLRGELEGVEVEAVSSVQSVVEQSDLLITATSSREPLVRAEWLRPGMHLTALGGDGLGKVELETAVLTKAKVFVDSAEANLVRGEVELATRQGLLDGLKLPEIGKVISGEMAGRTAPHDLTVAKLVGLGVQDLAAVETALGRL